MRVAALTSGTDAPSARFRVRQFIGPLRSHGIEVREYVPAIDKYAQLPPVMMRVHASTRRVARIGWRACQLLSRLPGIVGRQRADVSWLNREMLPGRFTLERIVRRPIVFDVDDAIWQALPDGVNAVARIAGRASVVFAGNRYIAEHFAALCQRVELIPTAIDTDRFRPEARAASDREPFIVGWTGTAGNYPYLYAIEHALHAFLRGRDAQLLVMAERPPAFNLIPPHKVRYVRWSPSAESAALRELHVGLMPMPDSDWARAKCACKLLQYMATGLPVVVSPVGVNREILAKGELGLPATGVRSGRRRWTTSITIESPPDGWG